MKKLLVFFLILLLGLSSTNAYFAVKVNAEKDNVTVTEETLYGDKSYADGITVSGSFDYASRILWNINHRINEGITTKFDFSKSRRQVDFQEQHYISVDYQGSYFIQGHQYANLSEDVPLYDFIKKVVDETPVDGRSYQHTTLKEYYEYYPLEIRINISDKYILREMEDGYNGRKFTKEEQEICDAFDDYFKIPVLDGHTIAVTVKKNGNSVDTVGIHTRLSDEYPLWNTYSVSNDSKCFFAFDNRTSYNNNLDVSQIKGGFGIYCLPYEVSRKNISVDTDGLSTILPLDENAEINQIKLSSDNKRLMVFTKENSKEFLRIVDTENGELLQEIVLTDLEDTFEFGNCLTYENVTVVRTINNELLVFSHREKGELVFEYAVDESPNKEEIYISEIRSVMNLIGDKLVVLEYNYNYQIQEYSCSPSYSLLVYNKEGLKFRGNYFTSLRTGSASEEYTGSYYIYPKRNFKITFE